ncbi:MAG: hypothetical protein KBF21_09040 [Thermoanaerobaculia bacterium]|nr:hypothetical protein [Thermoanaerobaculia bacterium]MBP9824352.1 hypothetical protein [Thermoanaerobaculia bacterium]
MSLPHALRSTFDLAIPSPGKGSNKVERRRWVLGGLSALAIAGLAAFHAALLAGRLADASIAHPEVLLQWVGALLLGAGAWALRRQGASLVSGRGALVFWLLVLLLHVGFGSGLAPTGEQTGSSRELLLLLPFATFTLSATSATTRGLSSRVRRPWELPHALIASRLRFPSLDPCPATSSAGAGPDRFSPRPPPHS